MKQVIFICLLSISLCLSATNGTPTETDPKHADVPTTTEKAAPADNPSPPGHAPAQSTEANPTPQGGVPNTPAPDQKGNTPKESNTSPKEKDAATLPTPITEKTNKTTEKGPSTPNSTVPANPIITTTSTTTSSSIKPTAATEPEHKATVPPKTPQPVPVQARGFDGASFVGGIILTLGLLAIGFMGFKYYKNQTERNYHTL